MTTLCLYKRKHMKNKKKITPFKSTITTTPMGVVTTLLTPIGVATKESIVCEGKSLLATYVYKKNETYDLVYSIVDTQGKEESFVEEDGILPTLFLNPTHENYVSIVPYDPDKELEVSLPLFHREAVELPKGNRPFTGDFIGITEHFSVFYDVDIWSDTKPDKLLAIEFKNGVIKKKHTIKIPLPRDNKIAITNGEIHIIAKEKKEWVHRRIGEKGNSIKERNIGLQAPFSQILSASFENKSYLLSTAKGKLMVQVVFPDGQIQLEELFDIKDPLFSTWQPIRIAENTFVIRFTTEFGNGWFTIKEKQLLEAFYSKGVKGYRNLITNDILELDDERLVISSINQTTNSAYAVVLYPMCERGVKNTKVIIVNRMLK